LIWKMTWHFTGKSEVSEKISRANHKQTKEASIFSLSLTFASPWCTQS
jgi:hypothetical protein